MANVKGTLPAGMVAFLFTDVEGSTRLWEQQPAAMQQAMQRHDAILFNAVAAHAGTIFKNIGHGMYAVFATAHDALDARNGCPVRVNWGGLGHAAAVAGADGTWMWEAPRNVMAITSARPSTALLGCCRRDTAARFCFGMPVADCSARATSN